VVADPSQFADDHADVLAAPGQLDVEELLHRVVPGDLIQGGTDVVLAVGDRDILVEIQVLAQLLEPGVQVADIGRRADDPLAVQLQDQADRRVRGGVLRPEVERPGVWLGRGPERGIVEQVGRHDFPPAQAACPA